jgi:hypothetical protein
LPRGGCRPRPRCGRAAVSGDPEIKSIVLDLVTERVRLLDGRGEASKLV